MFSKTVRLTLFLAVFFAAVAGIYSRRGTSTVTLNVFYTKMEAAFERRDYNEAVAKIHQLLERAGPDTDGSYEKLYFNLGLGNLLAGNFLDAEASFQDCIRRYPEGKYFYRCHLGLGRTCMLGEGAEQKEQAIQALTIAAKDRECAMEAGHWLARGYTDLNRRDKALSAYRDLIGAEARTPEQTTAAVEHIAFLSKTNNPEALTAWLDYISDQPGVRDLMAWFVNQVVVRADELCAEKQYEFALALYRAIPSRVHILESQKDGLRTIRKQRDGLHKKMVDEWRLPFNQRSSASRDLNSIQSAITLAEQALKAIEEKPDLDAALLMRRGRCLFYLKRDEEALICFRTLLKNSPVAPADAESAAYAEIVILNKRKDFGDIKSKCDAFMRKHPESPRLEEVATLVGEVLVQSGKWKEVGEFYRGMEARFPKSENVDRFVFFQGLAFFQDANFKECTPLFEKFLKAYPNSALIENAQYYLAMSHFLSNNYEKTIATCRELLAKFPGGRYVGDLQYRISYIDFNDKDIDQTDKIIRDLGNFLKEHPDDLTNGSMLCLLADTYRKKMENAKTDAERKANEDLALETFDKAIWLKNGQDDVIDYALNATTTILQVRKDWKAIAELHGKFLKTKPKSQLVLLSATWVAWAYARDRRAAEATELLASTLKLFIADPSCEQVEPLIDQLVKSIVPRKMGKDIDYETIDKQMVDLLNKNIDKPNITTEARVLYARARLARKLRRGDLFDFYMKGIATLNIKDPSVLSPVLLAASGDILLKGRDLDGAEAMFKHLDVHYPASEYVDHARVSLGYIALSRNKPEQALGIFDVAIRNQENRRLKEATLGKLQALMKLNRLEPASKFALDVVGDKMFRGETTAKAYLLLGEIYRKQAAAAEAAKARELLWKAHAVYQRVYNNYQEFHALCLDAYMQAYETLMELKEEEKAKEVLEAAKWKLKNHQKPAE